MRDRAVGVGLCVLLLLTSGAVTACDREDRADVEEVGNEVEEGAEDVGREVDDAVDEADSDGKDD
jgi:hypothetical protein